MALHDRAPKMVEFQEQPEVVILEPQSQDAIFIDEGEITVAHAPEKNLPSTAAASSSVPSWVSSV